MAKSPLHVCEYVRMLKNIPDGYQDNAYRLKLFTKDDRGKHVYTRHATEPKHCTVKGMIQKWRERMPEVSLIEIYRVYVSISGYEIIGHLEGVCQETRSLDSDYYLVDTWDSEK